MILLMIALFCGIIAFCLLFSLIMRLIQLSFMLFFGGSSVLFYALVALGRLLKLPCPIFHAALITGLGMLYVACAVLQALHVIT